MPVDSLLTLKLPEGYTFADLKLRRCDDDAIDLDKGGAPDALMEELKSQGQRLN
jgi:hypothetical protein